MKNTPLRSTGRKAREYSYQQLQNQQAKDALAVAKAQNKPAKLIKIKPFKKNL